MRSPLDVNAIVMIEGCVAVCSAAKLPKRLKQLKLHAYDERPLKWHFTRDVRTR